MGVVERGTRITYPAEGGAGGEFFSGRVLNQVVTMVIRAPVPSAQMLCPTVPAAVDQAIKRALAKSAAERFATMEEFVAALGISPV